MCSENYHWHHDYFRLAWDSGFTFNTHKSKSTSDWSSISLLDIDRITRDRDVAIVEKFMGTVLNYCLDEDQTRVLEPTFVKVFQLSQLSVQYLQFCKRYLDNTVILLKKELSIHKEENSNLKTNTEDLKTEINKLKKQIKELKQSIQSQQVQSLENILPMPFKCNICSKVFLSEEFLLGHVKRRHEFDSNPFQTETDRLQLEIKELKERLNSTEKYIQGDHNTNVTQEKHNIPNNDTAVENAVHVGELKEKFDHLKQYVERELTVLREEKNYQEKYEKWFEVVFQRLDNSKKELNDKENKLNMIGDGCKLCTKDSTTQTNTGSCVETETMTDDVPYGISEEKLKQKPIVKEIDIEKIQNDIRINTESHLDQLQDVLDKKLSGGFQQIQSQMNCFWKRLSDMELEKQQNPPNHEQEPQKPANTVPVSVPKRKGDQLLRQSPQKFVQIPQKSAADTITVSLPKRRDESVSSSSSSDCLEKNIIIEPRPKPAPRVVRKFPTITQSTPIENTLSTKKTNMKPIVTQKPQDSSSEESSSDDTFEVVKAPKTTSPIRDCSKGKKKQVTEVAFHKSKPTPKYIQAKPLKDNDMSSESESEETLSKAPQIKPSNTSTLGQMSLTSLKQAVRDKDVIKGLNHELLQVVNLRLKEIGISPQWNGIPERTYAQSMKIVKHQSDLCRRKYTNYCKVRAAILDILNDIVKKASKATKQGHKKREEKNTVIVKQLGFKKRAKSAKKTRTTVDTRHTADSEDSDTKPHKTFTKNNVNKENIAQIPTNIPQDKAGSVGATPIKKKVLFDLEDSSSTSKINTGNIDPPKMQRNALESHIQFNNDRTVYIGSPTKKQVVKDTGDSIKTLTHKPQPTFLKINDGGSTTSATSSILRVSSPQVKQNESKDQHFTKDDISDWDVSDILT